MKKPKHVTRFGQQILLSENIVVFDSLFVCSFGYKKNFISWGCFCHIKA
jgi:hypothetical protein